MTMAKKIEETVKAGTSVIICKDKKILVGQRKGSHGAGCWAFPGGHIDFPDKDLKSSGEREVFEETGMLVNIYSPDNLREDLFTSYNILSENGTKAYVTCYLLADYISGGEKVNETCYKGLEPQKCEHWHLKSLDELAKLILDEKAKTWIPIVKIAAYLTKIWNDSYVLRRYQNPLQHLG